MRSKKTVRIPSFTISLWWPNLPDGDLFRKWIPTPGNIVFTLLIVGGLAWAQAVGAVPGMAPQSPTTASTGTVAYQGRLANPAGQPLTGVYGMSFRLYANSSGGSPLWTEQWTGSNSVQVSDGLFNVMLGSLTPIPESVMATNGSLWLGITVGSDDEMSPRVQLGSVPFSVQAVTVPDGSITQEKLAPGVGNGTLFSLSPTNTVTTTSTAEVDFGSISLSENSDLYISTRWVLQNNTSGLGLQARLKIDGTEYDYNGGVFGMSALGIAYTESRSYVVPSVAAGTHTFKLVIDQFPFQSGHQLVVWPYSSIWVRAVGH